MKHMLLGVPLVIAPQHLAAQQNSQPQPAKVPATTPPPASSVPQEQPPAPTTPREAEFRKEQERRKQVCLAQPKGKWEQPKLPGTDKPDWSRSGDCWITI